MCYFCVLFAGRNGILPKKIHENIHVKRFLIYSFVYSLLLFCPGYPPSSSYARHLHLEKYYQDIWCDEQKGLTEIVLQDGTRCDCLTETHAVEIDFGSKFFEGISQALHHGMLTGKQAALVLIVEKPGDWKFVERAKKLIEFYRLPVVVFVIEPGKETK